MTVHVRRFCNNVIQINKLKFYEIFSGIVFNLPFKFFTVLFSNNIQAV